MEKRNQDRFGTVIFLFLSLLPAACSVMDKTNRSLEGIYSVAAKSHQTATNDNKNGVIQTGDTVRSEMSKVLQNYNPRAFYGALKIEYPYDQSLFPYDIASPTFEWLDKKADSRNWLVIVEFKDGHKPLYVFCREQHWTPDRELWDLMKRHSVEGPAQITIVGVSPLSSPHIVSKGVINISTSRDEVGAPIMFRRVPPIFSYAAEHPEQIEWVLADVSSYEKPPVIISKQPMCGNCHTFSRDGTVMGMDMDYRGDKGAYFITTVREDIELSDQDFMSWNDLPRTDGLKTTALYSRISPDGSSVASTVNDILFLVKIPDPYFSQLFYPLQGSLAVYSNLNKTITPLPGADLPDFVQTDPAWSPDGNHLLFSRAPSKMDRFWDLGGQVVFSVEEADIDGLNKRYPIKFDVYRIPFNGGEGGREVS